MASRAAGLDAEGTGLRDAWPVPSMSPFCEGVIRTFQLRMIEKYAVHYAPPVQERRLRFGHGGQTSDAHATRMEQSSVLSFARATFALSLDSSRPRSQIADRLAGPGHDGAFSTYRSCAATPDELHAIHSLSAAVPKYEIATSIGTIVSRGPGENNELSPNSLPPGAIHELPCRLHCSLV
jgi:hypothetical protein